MTPLFFVVQLHFDISPVMDAGVPCFALHRLPMLCRHYVTFFKLRTSKLQKLKILRFLIFKILNFYNRRLR